MPNLDYLFIDTPIFIYTHIFLQYGFSEIITVHMYIKRRLITVYIFTWIFRRLY